jgi:hypothetical protein
LRDGTNVPEPAPEKSAVHSTGYFAIDPVCQVLMDFYASTQENNPEGKTKMIRYDVWADKIRSVTGSPQNMGEYAGRETVFDKEKDLTANAGSQFLTSSPKKEYMVAHTDFSEPHKLDEPCKTCEKVKEGVGFNPDCLNCQVSGQGCAVHYRMPAPEKDWKNTLADMIDAEAEECTRTHEPNCHANEIIEFVEWKIKEAEERGAKNLLQIHDGKIKEMLEGAYEIGRQNGAREMVMSDGKDAWNEAVDKARKEEYEKAKEEARKVKAKYLKAQKKGENDKDVRYSLEMQTGVFACDEILQALTPPTSEGEETK